MNNIRPCKDKMFILSLSLLTHDCLHHTEVRLGTNIIKYSLRTKSLARLCCHLLFLEEAPSLISHRKAPVTRYTKHSAYSRVVCGDTDIVFQVNGSTVENKLCQLFSRWCTENL